MSPSTRRHNPARRRTFETLLAVAVGGAIGTLARYELSSAIPFHPSRGFPWAIFTVNVVGAFTLGLVATHASERGVLPRWWRPLLAVGFCGGLTTFSTWMVDAVRIGDEGRVGAAALDVGATLVAGFLALLVGVWTARSWTWRRRTA